MAHDSARGLRGAIRADPAEQSRLPDPLASASNIEGGVGFLAGVQSVCSIRSGVLGGLWLKSLPMLQFSVGGLIFSAGLYVWNVFRVTFHKEKRT